ncbi:MAG: hypothetical protein KDE51_27145 [Anaerolineales bacterium]|nr:hypothetical protein [Anaerolineales bacterium]
MTNLFKRIATFITNLFLLIFFFVFTAIMLVGLALIGLMARLSLWVSGASSLSAAEQMEGPEMTMYKAYFADNNEEVVIFHV